MLRKLPFNTLCLGLGPLPVDLTQSPPKLNSSSPHTQTVRAGLMNINLRYFCYYDEISPTFVDYGAFVWTTCQLQGKSLKNNYIGNINLSKHEIDRTYAKRCFQ